MYIREGHLYGVLGLTWVDSSWHACTFTCVGKGPHRPAWKELWLLVVEVVEVQHIPIR